MTTPPGDRTTSADSMRTTCGFPSAPAMTNAPLIEAGKRSNRVCTRIGTSPTDASVAGTIRMPPPIRRIPPPPPAGPFEGAGSMRGRAAGPSLGR